MIQNSTIRALQNLFSSRRSSNLSSFPIPDIFICYTFQSQETFSDKLFSVPPIFCISIHYFTISSTHQRMTIRYRLPTRLLALSFGQK